jgi:hypothetical protein
MSFFLSNNEIKVIKNEEKYSYSIEFSQPSKSLIFSLTNTHLISGATITDNYKTFIFKAITIQTLTEFQKSLIEKRLNHETSLKMALSLSKQLNYLLTKTNKSFLKYNSKNILVIDEDIFIYLSTEDLVKREKEDLCILMPFSKKDYISPELLNVKSIPIRINYKTIYYSLGLLIADCISILDEELILILTEKQEKQDKQEMQEETIVLDKIEKSIGKTNLFYFLSRCLKREAEKRCLIYI